MMGSFHHGTAVLGTRHGKEAVIVPTLRAELGLEVELLSTLDTDRFGTFTREVPRLSSARETVRAKALAALAEHGRGAFGIASEGSFGPHPRIPFVAGGVEIVLLIEKDFGLELAGVDVTTETNFASKEVEALEEALAFAAEVSFPSHGVIVMACEHGKPAPTLGITKGIVDAGVFEEAVKGVLRAHTRAWIETDMRAHVNLTRMRSIERATFDLARVAKSLCPSCARPGYVVVEHVAGLPCGDCGLPTGRARAEVLACSGCGRREERPLAGGPTEASAFNCERCNP